MKTNIACSLTAIALLLGSGLAARASSTDGYIMDLSSVRTLTPPGADASFNSIIGENSGAVVVVWDVENGSIVQRCSPQGAEVWRQSFTWIAEGECSRVLLGSGTHTLWCSPYRWALIDNATGTITRQDNWSMPDLDPNKIIHQNNVLHIVSGNTAYLYDTNMNFLGQSSVAIPSPCVS